MGQRESKLPNGLLTGHAYSITGLESVGCYIIICLLGFQLLDQNTVNSPYTVFYQAATSLKPQK